MSDPTTTDLQARLDADVAIFTKVLTDFGAEWAQQRALIQQLLTTGRIPAGLDFTKLDALAAAAQQMDTAWQADVTSETAPAPVPTPEPAPAPVAAEPAVEAPLAQAPVEAPAASTPVTEGVTTGTVGSTVETPATPNPDGSFTLTQTAEIPGAPIAESGQVAP